MKCLNYNCCKAVCFSANFGMRILICPVLIVTVETRCNYVVLFIY